MLHLFDQLKVVRTHNSRCSVASSPKHKLWGIFDRSGCAVLIALFVFISLPITTMAKAKPSQPPNILFIIMDDVGMDQVRLFGYGGNDRPGGDVIDGRVPQLPSIEAVAGEGVAFRNTWSMPACSTSRAVFFTGRYPLRTNVLGALGALDLANAMVSPHEVTLPLLLEPRGYKSALFGKFHLGLQGNNPFDLAMTHSLGWDYFFGWLDDTGDPSSIDTTAGGVSNAGKDKGDDDYDVGPYSCGFVPAYSSSTKEGADFGACYDAKGKCENLSTTNDIPPGRTCRDRGGILDPAQFCQKKMPGYIDFTKLNGHYVSPLVIVGNSGNPKKVDPTDIRARTYRGSSVVDGAIDWINKQPKTRPWMASISFASAHTPAMQPPQALLNEDAGNPSALSCAAVGDTNEEKVQVDKNQRELTTDMIEAMDKEIARLLVSIGVAAFDEDGKLDYSAANNEDTMIVILGDNGTLAQVVNTPFNPERAKGTAYQTGVWVPLVIAGPLVKHEGRQVKSMVNIADLYYLFGEIAGVKVEASVPRKLDAKPMLVYLTNPDKDQDPVRTYNFTQVGNNVQVDFALNQPCTIGQACTQIPVSKTVCSDNGGTWWGKDSDVEGVPPGGHDLCCQVNQQLFNDANQAHHDGKCDGAPKDNPDVCNPAYFKQQPLTSIAFRNKDFKIVRNTFIGDEQPADYQYPGGELPSCEKADPPLPDEFYAILEGGETGVDDPDPFLIDDKELNLIGDDGSPTQAPEVYAELVEQLDLILKSVEPCGTMGNDKLWSFDGNLDGVIDQKDLDELSAFASMADPTLATKNSSWYDVNVDGFTLVEGRMDPDGQFHSSDYNMVAAQLGTNCAPE